MQKQPEISPDKAFLEMFKTKDFEQEINRNFDIMYVPIHGARLESCGSFSTEKRNGKFTIPSMNWELTEEDKEKNPAEIILFFERVGNRLVYNSTMHLELNPSDKEKGFVKIYHSDLNVRLEFIKQ